MSFSIAKSWDEKLLVSILVATFNVNTSLNIARALGYESVIVLGSEKYYPRFGFEEAAKYKITAPFDVPSENFMVLELKIQP